MLLFPTCLLYFQSKSFNIFMKIFLQKLNKIKGSAMIQKSNILKEIKKQTSQNDKLNDFIQVKKGQRPQVKNIQTQKDEKDSTTADKDEMALQRIKSMELLFNKKYLGNKNSSRSVNKIRLLKNPHLDSQKTVKLLNLKTGDLNIQVNQIEAIFRTQNKKTKKQKIIKSQLTDFQLYLTKRDILKEKQNCIQEARKLYNDQNNMIEEQKIKRRKQRYQSESSIGLKQSQQINSPQQSVGIKQSRQQKAEWQSVKVKQSQQIKLSTQQNGLIKKEQGIFMNNQGFKDSDIVDDDYFQKRFEQTIMKNKLTTHKALSIRQMLDPVAKQAKSFNQRQFFKRQLSQLQNIAKSLISKFKLKQRMIKDIFYQNAQNQTEQASALGSPLQSPLEFTNFAQFKQPQQKSTDWIINQCDKVRKISKSKSQFKVRKAKTLKVLKNIDI